MKSDIRSRYGFTLIELMAVVSIIGVLAAVVLQTAFLTPPLGGSLIILKGISPPGITMKDIIVGSAPFIGIQLVVLVLCIFFPSIILWLPSKMM